MGLEGGGTRGAMLRVLLWLLRALMLRLEYWLNVRGLRNAVRAVWCLFCSLLTFAICGLVIGGDLGLVLLLVGGVWGRMVRNRC